MKPSLKQKRPGATPLRKVREDLFEEELDLQEFERQRPGAQNSLQKKTKPEHNRKFFDVPPAFQSFDTQDEMDEEIRNEMRKIMEEEGFGSKVAPSMITDERSPWSKNQVDPFRDREPTDAELEEIKRLHEDVGITEKELKEIERQEYGDEELDEDARLEAEEEAAAQAAIESEDDFIPVPETKKQAPKPSDIIGPVPAENAGEGFNEGYDENFTMTDPQGAFQSQQRLF